MAGDFYSRLKLSSDIERERAERKAHDWKRVRDEQGRILLAMECTRCGATWTPEKMEKQMGKCRG